MANDSAVEGWKVAPETWQHFSQHWRSKTMEEVVGAERIHIQVDDDFLHFLVLDVYRTLLSNVISRQGSRPLGGVLLTGQPGTGKTTWLWFALAALLARKEDVVLYRPGRYYLFYGQQVYTIWQDPGTIPLSTIAGRPIWCLIDPDAAPNAPPRILFDGGKFRFPVQACSPNGERYASWWLKRRRPVIYGMPLWNKHDLLAGLELHDRYPELRAALASALENPPDPDTLNAKPDLRQAWEVARTCTLSGNHLEDATYVLEQLVDRSIGIYGEAARDVYDSIFEKRSLDNEITQALKDLTLEALVDAMSSLVAPSAESFKMATSRKLISLDVRLTLPNEPDDFVPKFKSVDIGKRVLERYAHLEHKEAIRLFNVFRRSPQSSVTAGWIFEGLVHGTLCDQVPSSALRGPLVAMLRGGTTSTPNFTTMQDSGTQCLPIRLRTYTVVDFSRATFAPPPNRNIEDLFYVPKAPNNPLFDSFFVELKTDPLTAVVWIFQVTTADNHRGSPRGYPLIDAIAEAAAARVQASQPDDRPAKRKRTEQKQPKTNVELKYVLVCPEPKQRVSWDMPEGWQSHSGDVFCQFVDFTTVFNSTAWG